MGVLLFGLSAFLLLVGQKAEINLQTIPVMVESFGWAAPLAFVLLYIFSPLIFVPATLLTAAAGILWHWPEAMLYVSLGCNLGANLGFLAGRLMRKPGSKPIKNARLRSIQSTLVGQGFYSMVFVRVVPVAPFHVVNVGAGAAGVKWSHFFWATLLATLPGRFLALYAIDNAGSDNNKAWVSAAAFVILMLAPMLLTRRKQKLNTAP